VLRLGDVLAGRYRLDAQAGIGGAGVVYRATDLTTGGRVAVKLLHGGGGFDTRRFEREVAILRSLSHPHIVHFEDSGEAPDIGRYLVMEWLDGETLTDRMKQKPLSQEQAIEMGVRLSEALALVHQTGIVHRDIKPTNVWLVDGDPARPKLLDFGIAKSVVHAGLTRTGEAFGTVGYMSPEQVCGERDLDGRADIFSLGCLLFECATGALPFRADSPQAWLMKLALDVATRANHVRLDTGEALTEVLSRMLEKHPADRFDTMSEVGAALGWARSAEGAAPASRSGPAIGMTEQRFASLLLFALAPAGDEAVLLSKRAAYFGGVVHEAPGGALVAFSAFESPAELARAAARLACELSSAWPHAALVVISVRVTPDPRSFDDAYEQGVGLMAHPTPGVTVDDATRGLLRSSFECTPRGHGRGFELHTSQSPRARGRVQMASSSQFVGRERELGALLQGFERAVTDRVPAVVLLTGPAGVGKSRIANEARARIRAHAARPALLVGSADDSDRSGAFGLLSAMLARHMGLSLFHGKPIRARRDELLAHVQHELPPEHSAFVAELLGELLIGPSDRPSPLLSAARSEARLMKDQLTRALGLFLREIVTRGPVLMVLEHLERADLASVILLDRLLATTKDAPFFVIASARPEVTERFPRLFGEAATTALTVPELPAAAARALARALLGGHLDRVERTLELSGHNPLFIEEIARSVQEGHDTALPESILALCQSRLDRLTDRERRFLRAASVFGRRFSLAGANSLLSSRVESDTAESLADRGVTRAFGEAELEFVSPALREVAYASIPERELARAHRAAAESLERSGRAGASELARHWELGRSRERAQPWLLRAGREALGGGDLVSAARHGEKAEQAATTFAALGSARVLRAEVEDLRWCWRDAEPHALGAMEVLEPGGVLWFVAAQVLLRVYARTSRIPLFTELVARLRAVEPHSAALNAAVLALAGAANSMAIGRHPDLDVTMQRVEALDRLLPEQASGRAVAVLAHGGCALSAGDLGAYLARRQEAAERFDRLFDWNKAIEAWGTAGYANALLGRYDAALHVLERCVQRATENGLATVHYLRHNVGYVLLAMGRFTEARAMLEGTLEPLAAHPHLLRGSQRYLARALVALGDLEGAERLALAALVSSEREIAVAAARADMAHVLAARGDLAEAKSLIEEAALGLTADAGFDEDELFIRLTLVVVRARSGDRSGARDAAQAGVARLAHLAAKISDPSARASFLQNVPEHRAIAEHLRRLE